MKLQDRSLGHALYCASCLSDTDKFSAATAAPFSQDVAVFMALSQRANESDYNRTRNATIEWIKNQCSKDTDGSIFIFMPRSHVAAVCKWANFSICIEQLMNTPFGFVRMNASEVLVRETFYVFAFGRIVSQKMINRALEYERYLFNLIGMGTA